MYEPSTGPEHDNSLTKRPQRNIPYHQMVGDVLFSNG